VVGVVVMLFVLGKACCIHEGRVFNVGYVGLMLEPRNQAAAIGVCRYFSNILW
jgi:hypothetical protein